MAEILTLTLINFVQNLSFLAALSVVSGFIGHRWPHRIGEVCQGLLFGAVAVIGMLNPMELAPGLFFDGRSVVISLCALYFGPLSTIVAVVMAAGCRIMQGGIGTYSGVAVVISSALIGLIFHYRPRSTRYIGSVELVGFGACVHISMLLIMLTLPAGIGWYVLRQVGLHVALTFPIATVIIGKILSDQELRRHHFEELQESNNRFRATLYAIGDGAITIDRGGTIRWMNSNAEKLTGWFESEARIAGLESVYRLLDENSHGDVKSPLERVLDIESPGAAEGDYLLRARDGSEHPISESIAPILDDAGNIWGVILVFRDQSFARKSEREARENQRRLQMSLEAAKVGTWEIDFTTRTANRSLQHDQIFGYPEGVKDWDFARFLGHVHPDDKEVVRESFVRSLKTGEDWRLECRIIWVDASVHHIWGRGGLIVDDDDVPSHMIGLVGDSTERYHQDARIRQQKALLDIASRIGRIGGWSIDLPNMRLEWSEPVCTILGEAPGTDGTLERALSYMPPNFREELDLEFKRCVEEGMPFDFENELENAIGEKVWVRIIGEAERDDTDTIVRIRGALQDVTERKRFESSLSESEKRFRQLADAMPLIVWTAGADGNVDYANRALLAYAGMSLDEPAVDGWLSFLHPDDVERSLSVWMEAVRTESTYSNEFRLRNNEGVYRWHVAKGIPIRDEMGHITKWYGTVTDIHDSRLIEEKLRLLAARLTSTLESITDAFFMVDKQWCFLYLNPKAAHFLNRNADELVGKNLWEEFPDVVGTQSETEYRRALTEQIAVEFETYYDPIEIWFEVRAFPSEGGLAVYCRDITEKKRSEETQSSLEDQLRQSQKMEAVGRLAGGVAHDFNNMLSVILGYSDILLSNSDFPEVMRDDLIAIHSAAERSASLTNQLLAYARKQPIAPKLLDLNETVPEMLKLMRRVVGEDIGLLWAPCESLWTVSIDPSQLDQILANLIVNARDVLDSSGNIIIETENVRFDTEYCESHPDTLPGEFAMLVVSDNGRGMDRGTLAMVFEPFFTTKAQGEGTGLGLATVYGIVKQNNGFINVYSEPGSGTTFRIYLPRHELSEQGAAPLKRLENEAIHSETVLLLEDEGALLALGVRLLEKLGYKVLSASTPGEALAIAEEYQGEINLLITDVIMPKMSGGEVAAEVRKLRPDIAILYVSGYTADVIADHGVLDDHVHFLSKPFQVRSLAQKIREVLGDSPSESTH